MSALGMGKRTIGITTAAALWLGVACGTDPENLFLEVGGEYRFTAAIVRSYDCDPDLGTPRDDALCGTGTGSIVVGMDTVQADMLLDTYLPTQVCEFGECRDDPSRGFFTGMATVRVVQCDGTDGSRCDEAPAARIPVRVVHAAVSCTGERLPVVCAGYEGRTVVSAGVEIPSTIQAMHGIQDGREIRGTIGGDPLMHRAGVHGEWVLR